MTVLSSSVRSCEDGTDLVGERDRDDPLFE
jgi:hypothetical protein